VEDVAHRDERNAIRNQSYVEGNAIGKNAEAEAQ
jgi:hypothetical protein